MMDECLTCGETEGLENECLFSERDCGHHCNHSWTHDNCHWCGIECDEYGNWPELQNEMIDGEITPAI